MAYSNAQITSGLRAAPGLVATTLGVGICLLALVSIRPDLNSYQLAYLLSNELYFTLISTISQATASAIVVVALALPVVRALHRQQNFPGRALLLHIQALLIAWPPLLVVLAVVAAFGQQGFLGRYLPGFPLYGKVGVLLGHVMLNLPFVVRVLLHKMQEIPNEHWRMASELRFKSLHIWRIIEWPHLRQTFLYCFGMVFVWCFSSFVVVLALGGGPNMTTLEVAIYQYIKLDYMIGQAWILSSLQTLCCGLVLLICYRPLPLYMADFSLGQPIIRFDQRVIADFAWIALLILLTIVPFFAIIARAVIYSAWFKVLLSATFLQALQNSLLIALASSVLCMIWVCCLLWSLLNYRFSNSSLGGFLLFFSNAHLLISPFLFATGLHYVVYYYVGYGTTLVMVLLGGMMALPITLSIMYPCIAIFSRQEWDLCQSLGLLNLSLIRHVLWPRLKAPLCFAFAVAMAYSVGDLSIIMLFTDEGILTLPLLLYQYLSNYRLPEAMALGAILAVLLLIITMLGAKGDRRGRVNN